MPSAHDPPLSDPGPAAGPRDPKPCGRCGSAEASPLFRAVDWVTGEGFDLLRCRACGLRRTDFRGASLAPYYGASYYGAGGRRFLSAFEGAVRRFRRSRARWVAAAAGRPGRILDFGCGRGLMLGELRASGWECVGTELSAELAEAARKERGVEVLTEVEGVLPFPDDSFDVATAWHSLEHLERPVRTLAELVRLLRPGGLLAVELPNADSLQARLGGRRWFHLDVPRHLVHFGRDELRDALSDLGLTIVRESTLSSEQGPFGMIQTLLNRVTFAPNVLYRLIRKAECGHRPGDGGRGTALRTAWDMVLTVSLAAPAGLIGTVVELVACLFGQGGVTRILAVKGAHSSRPPRNSPAA